MNFANIKKYGIIIIAVGIGWVNMTQMIINTVVTFVISSILGYCVSVIRSYKKKTVEAKENANLQNIALKTLLKSQLTNTYFVYSKTKKIPDYVYQGFLDNFDVYKMLGGNSYLKTIAHKMEEWDISKTDIL